MKIVDENGEWFMNMGQWPFHDPETDTLFQPHEETKAKVSAWLENQEMIVKIKDPMAPAVEEVPVPDVQPVEPEVVEEPTEKK